jgi:hypothetical protein
MTKKKIQDKPKFEIKKRVPKEKPDFFQNLTPFSHPVAEILNFHKEESDSITLIEIESKEDLVKKISNVKVVDGLDPLVNLDHLIHLDTLDHPVKVDTLDTLDHLSPKIPRDSESLLRQPVKNSNYPVSPARDFAKLPNSIRRAVQQGHFPGHSLQIYLYLYSLTRGAIQPKRAVRATKPKIKVGAGVGSDVTLNKHLNQLKTRGYLKITEIRGQYQGNEYEVIIPEELTIDPLDHLYSLEGLDGLKNEGLDSLENGPSRPFQTVESKESYAENKTFFKEEGKDLKPDDDPFSEFYKKFQAASETLTGKKLSKADTGNLSKLADLLILELNIAARRTGSISSVPAFLTEVLRRRLREVPIINNKTTKASGKDIVGQPEPESYQIKALDEKKREAALSELREFAEDSMLEDFKKWYTAEDWEWLKKELGKGSS